MCDKRVYQSFEKNSRYISDVQLLHLSVHNITTFNTFVVLFTKRKKVQTLKNEEKQRIQKIETKKMLQK